MDANELFDALKSETTAAGRQKLISQAVENGISLEEIREMLDYVDLLQGVNAANPRVNSQPSLWQLLIHACRFQINHR